MFGGEYKSKPRVSLRGASKKEKRTSLIHRNQAEREKREEQRRRINYVIKIQAFVRGYWARRQEHNAYRKEFDLLMAKSRDNCNPDIETIHCLLRYLLFFYSENKDCDRLISICQLLLKCSKNLRIQDYHRWTFQIKRFLSMCSSHMKEALLTKKPFAIPLRILEVFTSTQWYTQLKSSDPHQAYATNVALYLVKNGYFKHLRFVMEERIPSSLEFSSGTSTPLADSLIDLIMRPVKQTSISSADARSHVLCSFAEDLFVPKLSEQIKFYLLPKLQDPKAFPFKDFLQSLKMNSFFERHSSPNLLYCILTLAQTNLENLASSVISIYLETVLHTLRRFPQKVQKNDVTGEIDDSDDESACSSLQYMEADEQQEFDVIDSCINLLNSKSHVKLLLKLTVDQRSDELKVNDECIKLLCLICNTLIFEQKCLIHETRLLLTLSFTNTFLKKLWDLIKKVSLQTSMGKQIPLLQMVIHGNNLRNWEAECISPLLAVFCFLFTHLLFSLHDSDFRTHLSVSSGKIPFTLDQLSNMGRTLCDATLGVIDIMNHEIRSTTVPTYSSLSNTRTRSEDPFAENGLYTKDKWNNVLESMTHVVKQLYSRDTRLHYCPPDHWLSSKVDHQVDKIDLDIFFQEEGALDTQDALQGSSGRTFCHVAILENIPFVIPFVDRVELFQRILYEDKKRHVGNLHNFLMGPSIEVRIRRLALYQDAFDELNGDQDLRQKVHVKLINLQGLEEAGVDGGGLFREFLNECLKAGFDQNIGFFSSTQNQLLYPNPQAHLVERNVFKHYYFLGRMLGKAIYENMLVELPFASFFLCKLLSKTNTDVDINHLESLDPEVYRNLLYLKDCPNVEDLALNFTVVNNNLGESQLVELKPGGKDIVVTNQNRIEYIHLMADYRLNKQIRPHCNAFRSGLSTIINISWLRMFDHNEVQIVVEHLLRQTQDPRNIKHFFQMLISGAQVPIDLDDLKNHTSYSGGLHEDHVCIQYFWQVVSSFNDVHRRQLLKFVTSCSRPPLLGFKDLHPPFTVHTAGVEDRLPSASTCVNLLKLPEYKDVETMRQKLLYSIESGAGFELS